MLEDFEQKREIRSLTEEFEERTTGKNEGNVAHCVHIPNKFDGLVPYQIIFASGPISKQKTSNARGAKAREPSRGCIQSCTPSCVMHDSNKVIADNFQAM